MTSNLVLGQAISTTRRRQRGLSALGSLQKRQKRVFVISEQAFEALRNTSLFAGFNDEQLEMVPKIGLTHRFGAGDSVVRVGAQEAHPGLWLVLEGVAQVEVEGEKIRDIEAGNHFGEMALLTGEPRSADVVAQSDLVAMEFTDRHLMALIGREPAVAVAMLAELATRLRDTTAHLAETIRHSPEVAGIGEQAGYTTGNATILGPIEYALVSDTDG